MLLPGLEGLENRSLLTVVTWNTTAFPNGGSWDNPNSWNGGAVPTSSETAQITGLTSPGTVYLEMGNSDSVNSLIIDSTVTLEVINGSLSLGNSSSSTLGGSVIVEQGAAFNVGTGATVTLAANEPLEDYGSLSFGNGDTVSFPTSSNATTQIEVYGTMSATSTSFKNPGNAGGSLNQIYVESDGEVMATNSTFGVNQVYFSGGSTIQQGDLSNNVFNSTVYVPAIDVPLLTQNQSFQQVDILGGTLGSNQLTTLSLLGTGSTSGMYYLLPSGLNVPSGATLTISTGASVTIPDQQYLTVSGQLNVTGATVVIDKDYCCNGTADGIYVGLGGTMDVSGSTFTRSGTSNYESSHIEIAAGGHLIASGSTFSLDYVPLDVGATVNSGDITTNIFSTTLYVPVNDEPLLTGNQSFNAVELTGGLNSNQSVTLNPLGTATTTGQYYVLPNGLTVASGETLTLDTGASLIIPDQQYLTVSGQLNVTGAAVVIDKDYCCNGTADGIYVGTGGTMDVSGSTFSRSGTSTYESSHLEIAAGGHLIASGSTFSLDYVSLDVGATVNSGDITTNIFSTTLYVPVNDEPLLTGNQSFNAVELTGGLNSNQSVTLNPIGTATTIGQYYVLPNGLTIASGETLTINTGASLTILDQQYLTVSGQLNVTGAAVVIDKDYCCNGTADGIYVGTGGTMDVSGSTFSRSGTSTYESSHLEIAAGGHLIASGSTFSLDYVSLDVGATVNSGDITTNIFSTTLYVPVNDEPLLTGNQSFNAVELTGGLNSNQSVTLNPIGTATTIGQYYVLPNGLTIASGETLTINTGASLTILDQQYLTVSGQLNVTGAAVVIDKDYCCNGTTDGIYVGTGGTMDVSGSTFTRSGTSTYENSHLEIAAGGHLIASGSTFSLDYVSLDVGATVNSGDITTNIFSTTLYVPVNDEPLLTGNQSFNAVELTGGLNSNQSVTLNPIGTATTIGQYYVLPNGLTIASGETLTINTGASLTISDQQYLTVSGQLNLTGAAVVVDKDYCCNGTTDGIYVGTGGTMDVSGSTFTRSGTSTYENSHLEIAAGGHLIASGSTFSLDYVSLDAGVVLNAGDITGNIFSDTLYAPIADEPLLTDNESFTGVYLSGSLNANQVFTLAPIGTQTTAGQFFVFSGAVTIPAGASLTIATGGSVTIADQQVLTVDGQFNVTDAGVAIDKNYCCSGVSDGIVINNGGTMSVSDSSVASTGTSSYETTYIEVNFKGSLSVTNSTVNIDNLIMNSDSTDSMTGTQFSSVMSINAGANIGTTSSPTITGDNFSNVPANGIVPSGNSAGTIPLGGNYWGTTVPSQIEAKIDNYGNPNYPTVDFSPYISNTTGVAASPASTTFNSTSSQQIQLTATVTTSPTSQVIDQGTVTFTVYYGTEQIGSATTPEQVSNGSATATYTLPADEPVGDYTIDAYYSGYYSSSSNVSYLPATDTSEYLTVTGAATSTSVTSAAATFNSADDQSIPLSATVSSSGGTISEGIITFTILEDSTPVGSSVSANVTNNQAAASYDLLAGTAGGNYTIQAVYTDPGDFSTSTGTNTLTVGGAATTVTPSNATAAFSSATGEGTTLTADVSSAAGTINQGAVTFTIVNGSGTDVVPPIAVNVLNGVASENYILPASTGVGSYTIEAEYDGTPSYAASLPVNSTLTVSAAQTTTIASNASIPFNAAAQSVPLTASVTSPGGSVGGTVTFTIESGNTTIGSAVMVPVSAGTASTNYGLPPGQSLGVYTIDAVYNGTTDFGTSSDNMHSLTITQPPASQLVIATPPSSKATAGQTFAVQPVIDVEDQYGNVATGDNSTVVTVSLASGNGTVVGTLTATAVAGVATFTNLGENTAGNITLEFSTTGNIAPAISGMIAISPASASQLVLTQQPSGSATAGQAFPTQPIVKEEDQFDNVITSDSTSTVTVVRGTIGSSGLVGNSVTVTLQDGVADFSGLTYDKAETINLSFTTSAAGVSATSSNDIVVSPAPASQLVIVQQPPATATAAVAFSTQPVIYEEDPFNNLETGDNSTTIAAQVSGGVGPLGGLTSVAVTGGVARFTNLADDAVETTALVFTAGKIQSPVSSSIVVSPGPAAYLMIHTPPSSAATAGSAFASQPVIYLEDANGNLETGDNSSVVTVSLASGIGPLLGKSLSVTVQGGIATFSGLTDNTAETIALKFAADGLSVVSSNIVVSPAAPFRLAISSQPSSEATAGQAFGTQPVIEELDLYGNIETTDSSTVINASVAFGNGPLTGTTAVTLAAGIATFTNLADTAVGTIALGFTGGGLSVGPSDQITISAGRRRRSWSKRNPIRM